MSVVTTTAQTLVGNRFAGLTTVLRLDLRRELLALIIWTVALAATVLSSVAAIRGLYPTVADRSDLARSISADPAFLALTGRVGASSIGGVTAWRVGVLGGVAMALMGMFTVVHRTRGDEEAGRAELLLSGAVGRDVLLTAALLLAGAACVLVGAIIAVGALAAGLQPTGSLALGASLAGVGVVFACAAGVGAQLFQNARTATAATGALLAGAMALRAIGDVWPEAAAIGWLSPLAWPGRVDPFGDRHLWVLLLPAATGVALTVLAFALSRHRDLGLGLLPDRPGRPGDPRLRSGLALAVRLQRTTWFGWAAGFLLFGLLTGSLATGAGALIGQNDQIRGLAADLGGAGPVTDELLAAMARIAGLAAGGYAVAAALRLRSEEQDGRADDLLATGLSRTRWMGGHLTFSLGGSALLLVISGLGTGLYRGTDTGHLVAGVGAGLSAACVQIPAVMVIGGLTTAVVGVRPRLSSAGWLILGLSALLGTLGELLGLPKAAQFVSPYAHIPALPVVPMSWTPTVILLLVGAAASVVGVTAFGRRDVG